MPLSSQLVYQTTNFPRKPLGVFQSKCCHLGNQIFSQSEVEFSCGPDIHIAGTLSTYISRQRDRRRNVLSITGSTVLTSKQKNALINSRKWERLISLVSTLSYGLICTRVYGIIQAHFSKKYESEWASISRKKNAKSFLPRWNCFTLALWTYLNSTRELSI